ncbi:NAD-dependent epimerase/dehydratase family protein [Clostridium sp. 'deep sea']|uniref:NAD-dependent epimerase/dehydratase family protein n=1 Tax=Clostridium sp. 'deep sea' TaxID=2779445 RepID=UPI0018965D0B|nr:NAD-dependent epimerase/dehydratase family protein [Clostridium sp. 'deep sea']QOR33734.1 NAD-dependent epimerase/dehydratase family protein [Clostridium sp. 'deep sea']
MKILVIGGTRFIGRHVINLLLQEGHELTLFNRGKTANPFQGKVKLIKGDRKLSGDMLQKTKTHNFDAVIDIIAYNENDATEATRTFLGKVNHYIMISTRSVYQQPILCPIRESDKLESDPNSSYGYNKVLAENKFLEAYKNSVFPISILRLPAVYGEYDYQAREWYFIKRLFDSQREMLLPNFGLGINQREYTGNIANQISCILKNPQKTIGKAFNSGHKHYNTYQELVQIAANLMGKTIKFYGIKNKDMPYYVPLASDGVRVCSTGKLESIGYVEKYSVVDGLTNMIKYFTDYPISEYLFAKRQNVNMFDYTFEQSLINNKAIEL